MRAKAAVGEGSAQPFVKEEEQESNLHAFCGEAINTLTAQLALIGLSRSTKLMPICPRPLTT
jgi:hypothetical protein